MTAHTKKFHLSVTLAITLFAQAPLQATADSASYSWWEIGAVVTTIAIAVGSYFMWNRYRIQKNEARIKAINVARIVSACGMVRAENFILNPNHSDANFVPTQYNPEIIAHRKNAQNVLHEPFPSLPFINSTVKLALGKKIRTNPNQDFVITIPLITAGVASGDPNIVQKMIAAKADIHTPIEPLALEALLNSGTLSPVLFATSTIQSRADVLKQEPSFNATNHNLLYCLKKRSDATEPQSVRTQTQLDDIITILLKAGAKDPMDLASTMPRVPLAMNE